MRNTIWTECTATMLLAAFCLSRLGAEETRKDPAPAVRLAVSRDGLILLRDSMPLERFRSFEELARVHPGLKGSFEVEVSEPRGGLARVEPRKSQGGASRVSISAGEIPVVELLRYLSDTSGLPVVYDSTDKSLAELKVHLVAQVKSASEDFVRRLLETNRLRVTESASGSEGRVLLVELMDGAPRSVEPRPVPIIEVRESAEGGRLTAAERASSPLRRTARGPEGGPERYAGIELDAVPEVLRSQLDLAEADGVFVAEVDEQKSRQSRSLSMLEKFDVVTHVGEAKVGTPAKLVSVLNGIPSGQIVQLRVIRKGVTHILNTTK